MIPDVNVDISLGDSLQGFMDNNPMLVTLIVLVAFSVFYGIVCRKITVKNIEKLEEAHQKEIEKHEKTNKFLLKENENKAIEIDKLKEENLKLKNKNRKRGT